MAFTFNALWQALWQSNKTMTVLAFRMLQSKPSRSRKKEMIKKRHSDLSKIICSNLRLLVSHHFEETWGWQTVICKWVTKRRNSRLCSKCLELLKRDNGGRKQKHGEKRSINGVRTECLLVDNLLFLLLCKRSKKIRGIYRKWEEPF